MNRSDEIMERNERILDGLILCFEKLCPTCQQELKQVFESAREKNSCGVSCYQQAPQSYGNSGSGDPISHE